MWGFSSHTLKDWQIPITLSFHVPNESLPFRLGVPFSPAVLFPGTKVTLQNRLHQSVPLQSKEMAFWPDGSVRWLRLDFIATQENYFLTPLGAKDSAPTFPSARSSQNSEHPVLETESLRIFIAPGPDPHLVIHDITAGVSLQWRFLFRLLGEVYGFTALQVKSFVDPWGPSLIVENLILTPGGTFLWQAMVEPKGNQANFEFTCSLVNMNSQPIAIEDYSIECRGLLPSNKISLDLSSLRRKFKFTADKSLILQSDEHGAHWSLGKQSGWLGGLDDCYMNWEAARACSFLIKRFSKNWPKKCETTFQGLRFSILPGQNELLPGTAASMEIVGFLHAPKWSAQKHSQMKKFLQQTGDLWFTDSFLRQTAPVGPAPRLSPKLQDWLVRGAEQFVQETAENIGWRNAGDYRLGPDWWANSEYDTALGLLREGLRLRKTDMLVLAQDFLAHWRSIDQIHAAAQSWKVGLPAIHALDHVQGQNVGLGHMWVQGLLSEYAFYGKSSARRAAMQMGDALQKLVQFTLREDNIERTYSWPMIALLELHSFFPQRGYARTAENLMQELSSLYDWKIHCFKFSGCWNEAKSEITVNLWLLGGLLLETLDSYIDLGGKQDITDLLQACVDRLLLDGWDLKQQRFFHSIIVDAKTGKIVRAEDSLPTAHELYLFAGLARAEKRTADRRWRQYFSAWLQAVELQWPKKQIGNQYSLALRAVPYLSAD